MEKPQANPSLNYSQASELFMKKLITFTGRSRRSEFWWAMLKVASLIIIGLIFFRKDEILMCILDVFALLISISVFVRRMHDIGKSGWWWFLNLIPYLGVIILIIFACKDSDPEENKYGISPKYSQNYEEETPQIIDDTNTQEGEIQ